MADYQPSGTSTTVAAPITDSSLGGSGSGSGGGEGRSSGKEGEQADAPQPVDDVSNAGGGRDNAVYSAAHDPTNSANDEIRVPAHLQPPPQPSSDTATATAQPQPPPLKRFTSVNINKRFLEKTPSTSGTPSGGSPLATHASGGGGGSGQRRGESPASARSASMDRPAPSRLVTAKLTAVPQPSAASTSGWLRTNSSTPSATPTPPSSSPQPTANGPTVTHAQLAPPSGTQQSKRRPGELPSQNGVPAPNTLSSSTQQGGSKAVWGKVVPSPANPGIGLPHGREADKQMNDFPTAAEAAHGRKTKALNAQLAAETAAAQTAAQKQAMNETAAAFRGVHLDPNAHHWDEMEDEDSDFLAGVIEFGDGTQYKIENKAESAPSQDHPPPAHGVDPAKSPSSKSPPASHPHVTKEERFGEDFDRSWPRARTSPVRPTLTSSVPSRNVPPLQGVSHPSPTDGPASASAHSPQDGTSPTSRVLFNERSNRLEPWSNAKPRSGLGQAPGPIARRDSREDHPPFGLLRQQTSVRDAPPHSHPSSSNVQLLQKGSADSSWKGGAPRGFSHAPERGRWGAPSPRDEERPWEAQRRGSITSSDAPGTSVRDPSRDREGGRSRWDVSAVDADREQERHNSNTGMPPPMLPQSLARDRSRDTGRQLPPHLSRMPPPPVPPVRGREIPPHATVPHTKPPAESPSASVHSHLSPTSEKAPSTTGAEEVDKDSLVKDAMQLAIERAKRRKLEGEEEEKRRVEAAERARKKAEAMAEAQEEKKKLQALPPTLEEKKVLEPSTQDAPQMLPSKSKAANGLEVTNKPQDVLPSETPRTSHAENSPPKLVFGRTPAPPRANVPPGLPRRPSITPQLTPASQADSWRRAAPVPSSPPHPPSSPPPPPPPPPRAALPPMSKVLELDLSFQPDEDIEVVDFCDLGKLMGHQSPPVPSPPSPESESEPAPTPMSIRARRPVASDFFDDRPFSSREPLSPIKGDMSSWRRPVFKPTIASPPKLAEEELGTQTMPIFSTDEPVPVKEMASTIETKPVSASSSSPPLNRHSSHSDQGSSNATTQSVYVPPAALALRSPRTPSHFKEAPMSTLTDTMSRIKGALDGMQSQDLPPAFQLKEPKEKEIYEQRPQAVPLPTKTRITETSTALWRESRELRPEISSHVTKILTPPTIRPSREVFDITHPDPPRSPKPAWNAFLVRLPKESRPRDAISRKQLHFWNLPHPGVRWDILSWEPPVEGMNKRELSRDEIFHRKYAVKGGKLRVLLPSKRIVHSLLTEPHRETMDGSSIPALVTTAGVKIKFPSNALSSKEKAVIPSRTVSYDRPRESNVPSWRKSAMPLAQLKKERQIPTSVNSSPPDHPDHELNTTSRSPPPEPSTPLPHFIAPQNGITSNSSPASAHSATVSLPTNPPAHSRTSALRRPSGADVAFFRTLRGESEAETSKPLPRFTVTSELDTGESIVAPPKDQTADNRAVEAVQSMVNSSRGSPQNVATVEVPLPGLISSKPESKSSDDLISGKRPLTPPSTHTTSAWGTSPLNFSLKESPARSAPDPEHLKAVWSQPSGRTTATTSNSLKGIADDLPSIPFTVQDMKSEDGETPPPMAPAPPPSRLSLQEVTRAFQQVPGTPAPVTNSASRTPSYAQTPLLSSAPQQAHRSNPAVAVSLPPQHGVRPVFAPYPPSMVGHSPSPTLMYAPGVSSPAAHHRMPVNGPSPPVAHPIWLPAPPPQSAQVAAFMRPPPMMYPSPVPGASPGAPGHMMHRRMSVVSPGGVHPGPNMYHGHPMDMQGHMHQAHAQSPHHSHAHPIGHPVPHMHHIFSPPQHGQAPAMYAVPVGAGRGGMMPRPGPGYEGMQQVPHLPPHNPGYQPVPPTSFSHPFHS